MGRPLGLGDGRLGAAVGGGGHDRGLIRDVAVVDAAHPDGAHVGRERDQPARRDGSVVVGAGVGGHRRPRPAGAAIRRCPGLHLEDTADVAREIDRVGVFVVQRDPARVVGLPLSFGADRPAGRRDLVRYPAGARPPGVPIAVVDGRDEVRKDDHRPALGVEGHVVDPHLVGVVEDLVGLAGCDRRSKRRDARAVRLVDAAVLVIGVVDVDVARFGGMGIGKGKADGVATFGVVLHVRPLPGHHDQVPRPRPSALAVLPGRERRVPVTSTPEQVRLCLCAQPDRVRVGKTKMPGRVRGDRRLWLP